jgi:hypothetical protein
MRVPYNLGNDAKTLVITSVSEHHDAKSIVISRVTKHDDAKTLIITRGLSIMMQKH